MKLSIWQQFSSNHSASFSIIGIFETPAQAEQAANECRTILRQVAAYWQSLSETEVEARWADRDTLTPVEQRLSEAYQIEWSQGSLDWLPFDPDKAAAAVKLHKNVVGMENIGNTWRGSAPFDALLSGWGAQVYGWWEHVRPVGINGDGLYLLDITCDAPDEAVAQQIIDAFEPLYGLGHTLYLWEIPHVMSINVDDGTFKREGVQLHLTGIYLAIDVFDRFIRAIDYLKRRGCTHIDYQIHG